MSRRKRTALEIAELARKAGREITKADVMAEYHCCDEWAARLLRRASRAGLIVQVGRGKWIAASLLPDMSALPEAVRAIAERLHYGEYAKPTPAPPPAPQEPVGRSGAAGLNG